MQRSTRSYLNKPLGLLFRWLLTSGGWQTSLVKKLYSQSEHVFFILHHYKFNTSETPDSPCQYKSQISEANVFHFWTFLGFQCSAADLWLESNPGFESERQEAVNYSCFYTVELITVEWGAHLLTWNVRLKGGPITPGSSKASSDLMSYRDGVDSLWTEKNLSLILPQMKSIFNHLVSSQHAGFFLVPVKLSNLVKSRSAS